LTQAIHKKVGRYLKSRRKELALRQEDVGQWIGRSPAYISQVENGISDLSVGEMVIISRNLRMPPERFLSKAI
jgi:transcriptional regulator with XRE-family HTH domain